MNEPYTQSERRVEKEGDEVRTQIERKQEKEREFIYLPLFDACGVPL